MDTTKTLKLHLYFINSNNQFLLSAWEDFVGERLESIPKSIKMDDMDDAVEMVLNEIISTYKSLDIWDAETGELLHTINIGDEKYPEIPWNINTEVEIDGCYF